MENISIPFESEQIKCILDKPGNAKAILVIAHGAGAPMTHPFMDILSTSLVASGCATLRFNFPYMEAGRKSPGSPKKNIECWRTVVQWTLEHVQLPCFIGGKSYGGRMASHLMADTSSTDIRGLIYFGFPLHAPGKPSQDRASHLSAIAPPQLFLQGTKDALADFTLVSGVANQIQSKCIAIEGGDHSFKVKGRPQTEVIQEVSRYADDWITGLINT